MPEIEITFDDNGEVSMEGIGFTGKTCDQEMGAIEKALGTVTKRKNKTEYFKAGVTNARQRA